ncbi:MAG: phosphotransferase [Epsilonproteobacteria bacterium]|nr:phosphotransferase [Campylobacterota bacterium]
MNKKLEEWLEEIGCEGELEPVAADASFRKYYRLKSMMHSGIVMDASLQKESVMPFIDIEHRLYEAGVRVAKINTFNLEEGFIFMEDLGNTHLADVINDDMELYYGKAIESLIKMQNVDTEGLPLYDEAFLRFEMDLMQEWYLEKHLGITLDEKQQSVLDEALTHITAEVLSQPQGVFVHRDYHSRNLMFGCTDDLVVIDFQDARVGAVTYDLVSLLRDVYVELHPRDVERMALHFRDMKGLDVDDETFMRWFDYMGLQRHIKILGIFARLALRDGKEGYIKDIPLTLKYVLDVASKYPELSGLVSVLKYV